MAAVARRNEILAASRPCVLRKRGTRHEARKARRNHSVNDGDELRVPAREPNSRQSSLTQGAAQIQSAETIRNSGAAREALGSAGLKWIVAAS